LAWEGFSPPPPDIFGISRQILVTPLAKLVHAVIAATLRQWRHRLSACVGAGGGRFEHCF